MELSDDADGTVVADAVKLVRDNSGSTDGESKGFSYAYDANKNLTEITDSSAGAQVDRYAIGYTGLNRRSSPTRMTGSPGSPNTVN